MDPRDNWDPNAAERKEEEASRAVEQHPADIATAGTTQVAAGTEEGPTEETANDDESPSPSS